MKITKKILLIIALSLSAFSAYSATAPRDNIPSIGTVTVDTQSKGSARDVEITRTLREAIMADDQLSTSAHNIKIVTVKKAIILKGRVASKAEKVKIENLARARAGDKKVYNRLTY
ncbi:MAG: BON domain-containing protein [Bacteriovorax sp.]|nr:BON domain-containing protein [Bacteriovorax sp.]